MFTKQEKGLIFNWFNKNKSKILLSIVKRYRGSEFENYCKLYKLAINMDFESILKLPNIILDCVNEEVVIRKYKGLSRINKEYTEQVNFNTNLLPVYQDETLLYSTELVNIYQHYLKKLQYKPVFFPSLINTKDLYYSGHLPGWGEQIFNIHDTDMHLVPTVECHFASGKIKEYGQYYSFTECFRKEAGSRGQRDKGLIRTYQFGKCEIFFICKTEEWGEKLTLMVNTVCNLLKLFNFNFRVVRLPRWDMSGASSITFDVEIWLPISKRWIEISSISYVGDYQNKFRNIKQNNTICINGSCLPVGRVIVCLREYYTKDEIVSIFSNLKY